MEKSTAYSVLGLAEGAGEEQIKDAYRALAQKYSAADYEPGAARDEAERKMAELNEAFDTLMSLMRTGSTDTGYTTGATAGGVGRFPAIRQLINAGKVDEALSELAAVTYGANDAEWNFLMGSAYYYKGWLDQALQYFQRAVQLDPGNAEYQAALRNLAGNANGNMPGSPYTNTDPNTAAMNCACNTCSMMCCMDMCCSACRGC